MDHSIFVRRKDIIYSKKSWTVWHYDCTFRNIHYLNCVRWNVKTINSGLWLLFFVLYACIHTACAFKLNPSKISFIYLKRAKKCIIWPYAFELSVGIKYYEEAAVWKANFWPLDIESRPIFNAFHGKSQCDQSP